MSNLTTLYCTDEDLAIRAAGDFALLCPKDQKIAEGIDGVFAGDRWTVTSAAVDFQAFGLAPGHVVQLTKTSVFRGTEELAVVTVSPFAVTLKRKGLAPDVGQPPGPVDGITGVAFSVTTLMPQIEKVSYDLNRRYSIDDLVAGRRTSDFYDLREVQDACVLEVLATQYAAMSRNAGEHSDHFARQAAIRREELNELLARTVIHWKSLSRVRDSSPFSTHLSR